VRRGFQYPIAWDAPTYVFRVNAIGIDGLSRLGTVRSASPLLLATLMQVTRQNAMTLVAVMPAVFAGVAGLGAAVMTRASLEIEAPWVPVIGVLTWAAFFDVGIIQQHLDNALNVALVLSGLGAAVVTIRWHRGATAVGILLAAAGVAEWTFYAFGACVLAGGLALFVVTTRTGKAPADRPPILGLGAAIGGSAVLTALTFLSIPVVGGVGADIAQPAVRAMLRQRFIQRLHHTSLLRAVPLTVAGVVVAARARVSQRAVPARRLFLCLMASWTALTIVAGFAQWLGAPTAGRRLTSYFFVVPILTGVFVWWLGGRVETLLRPRAGAAVATVGALVVGLVFVVGFADGAWRRWIRPEQPMMSPQAVAQTAAAGRYLRAAAPGQASLFTLAPGISSDTAHLWWSVVQASLPPKEVPLARRAVTTPSETVGRHGGAPVVVLERYNRTTFAQAQSLPGARLVAPGVIVLNAPTGPLSAPPGPTPRANTTLKGIVLTGAVSVALLFVVGLGWALALLPHDPVSVVGLAPGLGAAAIILVALVWGVLRLPLHGLDPLWPMVMSTGLGWSVARSTRRRAARDAPSVAS
jgi:hypothetical protein